MSYADTDAFELKRMMRLEAHEKAFEIQVLGQRIYENERDKNVRNGSALIQKDFTTKMDNLTINQKIAQSAKTNETRIKKMTSRNECLEKLKAQTKARILDEMKPSSDLYRKTVKSLIIQGMIRLLEEEVEIKVRKGEQDMIQKMVESCEKEYAALMKKETDRDYKTKLTVLSDKFLTVEEGSEFGGVMLLAHGRRIVVPNTLQDRMNLVLELELPTIRKMLFQD